MVDASEVISTDLKQLGTKDDRQSMELKASKVSRGRGRGGRGRGAARGTRGAGKSRKIVEILTRSDSMELERDPLEEDFDAPENAFNFQTTCELSNDSNDITSQLQQPGNRRLNELQDADISSTTSSSCSPANSESGSRTNSPGRRGRGGVRGRQRGRPPKKVISSDQQAPNEPEGLRRSGRRIKLNNSEVMVNGNSSNNSISENSNQSNCSNSKDIDLPLADINIKDENTSSESSSTLPLKVNNHLNSGFEPELKQLTIKLSKLSPNNLALAKMNTSTTSSITSSLSSSDVEMTPEKVNKDTAKNNEVKKETKERVLDNNEIKAISDSEKQEIKQRMKSFNLISHNQFLCER